MLLLLLYWKKDFALNKFATVVLAYRLVSLVPLLQLHLVTSDFRPHCRTLHSCSHFCFGRWGNDVSLQVYSNDKRVDISDYEGLTSSRRQGATWTRCLEILTGNKLVFQRRG